MFIRVVSEIIGSEVSNLDDIIKLYKKNCDLLFDLTVYCQEAGKKPDPDLERFTSKLAQLNVVYGKIYDIVGDSAKAYLDRMLVPDDEILTKLSASDDPQLFLELHRQLLIEPGEKISDKTFNEMFSKTLYAQLHDHDEHKKLIVTHSLVNLIGSEQFFSLCELRKKALMEYEAYIETIQMTIQKAPAGFHEKTKHAHSFTGTDSFQLTAGTVITRFVKIKELGKQLKKKLKKASSQQSESSTKTLTDIAEVIKNIGTLYSDLDNMVRKLHEAADLTKSKQGKQPLEQLTRCRNEITDKKNQVDKRLSEFEKTIKNLESYGKNQPSGDLILEYREQMAQLTILKYSYQDGLADIDKMIAKHIRLQMESAAGVAKRIESYRSKAIELLSKTYKSIGLPIPEFKRIMPKVPPYKPSSTIKVALQEINKEVELSPEIGRSRKNSFFQQFLKRASKTKLTKQSSVSDNKNSAVLIPPTIIELSSDSPVLQHQESASDLSPQSSSSSSSNEHSLVGVRSQEAIRPGRVGEWFLAKIKEEQANKSTTSVRDPISHTGSVKAHVSNIERIIAQEDTRQEALEKIDRTTAFLDEKYRLLINSASSIKEIPKEMSKDHVTTGRVMSATQDLSNQRRRANTAPTMFAVRRTTSPKKDSASEDKKSLDSPKIGSLS